MKRYKCSVRTTRPPTHPPSLRRTRQSHCRFCHGTGYRGGCEEWCKLQGPFSCRTQEGSSCSFSCRTSDTLRGLPVLLWVRLPARRRRERDAKCSGNGRARTVASQVRRKMDGAKIIRHEHAGCIAGAVPPTTQWQPPEAHTIRPSLSPGLRR